MCNETNQKWSVKQCQLNNSPVKTSKEKVFLCCLIFYSDFFCFNESQVTIMHCWVNIYYYLLIVVQDTSRSDSIEVYL